MRLAVLRLLSSRRLAIAAMGLMAGFLAVATFLPDFTGPDGETLARQHPVGHFIATHLHPREATDSPRFLILPGFLFAGIALSIWQRVKVRLRQHRAGWMRGMERFRVTRHIDVDAAPAEALARVERALARSGYHVGREGDDRVVAARGDLGFVGSIGFHVGLLLVLLGVGASVLTRFSGELLLTEGFAKPLVKSSFLRMDGGQRFRDMPDHAFLIDDFVAQYSQAQTPVDFAMSFAVLVNGRPELEQVVRVNGRLTWRDYDVVLHRYGFAPGIQIQKPDGSKLLDAVGPSQLLPPGKQDSLVLDGGGQLVMRLYPDLAGLDAQGQPHNLSLEPRRPTLFFDWRHADGSSIATGRLALGEQTTAAGHVIRFDSLSYWGDFLMTHDGGIPFLMLGSLLGSLGLALRVARPDKTAHAQVVAGGAGTRIHLEASTRYFPALHEQEVDRVAHQVTHGQPGAPT